MQNNSSTYRSKGSNLNVILITIDALRADFVGCCSDGRAESITPNIDQFASRGILFRNAFSQGPWTLFSMPSLFTGRYPSSLKPMAVKGTFGISTVDACTLPESLAGTGYQTAGFHSNPFLSRVFGFQKGFQSFYDDLFLGDLNLPQNLRLLLNRMHRLGRVRPYLPANALNRKVLAWLERAQSPFFLWVHYMDAHGPHQSRRGFPYMEKLHAERLWRKGIRRPAEVTLAERELMIDFYKEEIAFLDDQLGRFFDGLSERGFYENTIIVLTADHGDEFYEHGGYTHDRKLYDELINVPLIIKLPTEQPQQVDDLVELIQIFPTILDLLGNRPSPDLQGASLLPLIEGHGNGVHEYIISEAETMPHYVGCIRGKEWKLICNEKTGRNELYHLPSDPGEETNLIDQNPEIAEDLLRKLNKHRQGDSSAESVERLTPEEEELVEQRLRELGYL